MLPLVQKCIGRLKPLFLLLLALISGPFLPRVDADALTDRLAVLAAAQIVPQPLDQWKFHQPDVPDGEAVRFDDSAWPTVAPGYVWSGENTKVWFRTRYVVPQTINGVPTRGTVLRLDLGMDDDGEVYVNSKFLLKFNWDAGQMTLTDHAEPGQVFVLAVRGLNGPGTGGLRHARLVYSLFAPIERYVREAQFVDQIAGQMPAGEQTRTRLILQHSEGQLDLSALEAKDYGKAATSLAKARNTLLSLASITRTHDVYYVGHAHIDMNWLWTWPETVDVCRRTWDSALHLMDLYPDFGFVQSQPGAYNAIRQQFPAEFARMQTAQKRGQWDLVGGLYDESDTDMPSGEGLARSLFLGQRFFKTNFGRYATTGWLPDSFGHSWQMPQLMQEAGIQNFYHMRCGDGIRYAWWQSPDGSRVLKANTDNYDEAITPEELSRPWAIERSYGLKEALVVFGVGDHGGGPTREMIDQGKEFGADPLFPKVHFVTADTYFDHLRTQPQTQSLPVVDTDLQYTFTGCYTTHADLKKAVRSSENNLYAAEVYSSLASMLGQPYPTQGFEDAWKPTAFAQFHDIMCGSAIHSTYDWMHQQLAPAFAFEQSQTDKALAALTAATDTRGAQAGEQAVVVWNPLSFARTDIVKVTVDDAAHWAQARDTVGKTIPMQALDAHTLAFVAPSVPAFGHRTFFLSDTAWDQAKTPPALARETTNSLILENTFLRAVIAKDTGLLTNLYDKQARQEMIASGQPANGLQVLGDNGSAWDFGYTGEQHLLTTGATVQLIANGPVCAVVRVTHTFGKSTFTQDLTLYDSLPRLDVPTTVDWEEHGQALKVAFPLAQTHPSARVGIPYGSIERPTTGQENPGQKWMDVTEVRTETVGAAAPLNLAGRFNSRSTVDFDSQKRTYPAALMLPAGVCAFGAAQIPFRLAGSSGLDNIACDGQTIPVPAGVQGNTLYLLGAGALGSQGGTMTVVRTDGTQNAVPFQIGDWVVGGGRSEDGLKLDYRLSETGTIERGAPPHLWIVAVPLPTGKPLARIVLPFNTNAHLFALTLGSAPQQTPLYGLTVLNDCKYGSDTNGAVFRLTLLRSSHDPDPNPDAGLQTFTYSLLPHAGDWRTARSEQAGLALNLPLHAVLAERHAGKPFPTVSVLPADTLVVGALKHCEDGPGYILRLFETQGRNTVAHLRFSQPVRVQETDILERPVQKRAITVQGNDVRFPVGHDQIVTLHILGLPG